VASDLGHPVKFPTLEVGYTSAMPRREDHEVHKDMWGIWGGGGGGVTSSEVYLNKKA